MTANSLAAAVALEPVDPVVSRLLHSVRITDLATQAGLDRKALFRYATTRENRSGEHRALPLALAPVLELATGRTDLVDWHAAALGGLFVRRPLAPTSVAALLGRLAAVSTEFADVQRRSADALGDSCLTPDEARAVIAEVRELQRQAESYALSLEAELLRKPLAKAARR